MFLFRLVVDELYEIWAPRLHVYKRVLSDRGACVISFPKTPLGFADLAKPDCPLNTFIGRLPLYIMAYTNRAYTTRARV